MFAQQHRSTQTSIHLVSSCGACRGQMPWIPAGNMPERRWLQAGTSLKGTTSIPGSGTKGNEAGRLNTFLSADVTCPRTPMKPRLRDQTTEASFFNTTGRQTQGRRSVSSPSGPVCSQDHISSPSPSLRVSTGPLFDPAALSHLRGRLTDGQSLWSDCVQL